MIALQASPDQRMKRTVFHFGPFWVSQGMIFVCSQRFSNANQAAAWRDLPLWRVVLLISVPAVLHGKAAVGPRRLLDVVHGPLVGDPSRSCSTRSLIGDELLWHVVIPGVNGIMQLPKIFQSRRCLQRLEGRYGATLFRSIVHDRDSGMLCVDQHRQGGYVLAVM